MSKLPPLTSFGPEILQTLIEGSKREILIELPYKEAVVLRQRIHQLRARMREDKHALTHIVSAAKVTIRWGPEVASSKSRRGVSYPTNSNSLVEMVIRPQDSTFRSALEKAGIQVEVPEIPLPKPTTILEEPDDILTDFLRDRS